MKKFLILNLVGMLVIGSLTGCGKNQPNENTQNTGNETATENTTGEGTTNDTADTNEAVEDNTGTTDNSNQDTTAAADSVAGVLMEQFLTEAKDGTDTTKLAEALSKNSVFGEVSMTTMEVEPGYLSGFENEISGFSKGTMFAPMIGTIPFVGYVFETDDTQKLVDTLIANAKLDWNICTSADEMQHASNEKYVLFVMSPKSFE